MYCMYTCALYIKTKIFFCPPPILTKWFLPVGDHIIPFENAWITIPFPVPISAWHWRWAQTLNWPIRVQTGEFFFDSWWLWNILFLSIWMNETFSFFLSPRTALAVCYHEERNQLKIHEQDRIERLMGNNYSALILLLGFSGASKVPTFYSVG